MRSDTSPLRRGTLAATLLAAGAAALACRSTSMDQPTAAPTGGDAPPVCEKRPQRLEAHGDVRIDDYYWLNQREDADVLAYLEAENAYADARMAPTEALQEELFQELVSRIQETDVTVPVKDGPYAYYTRTEEGLQYPIHCRRPAGGGPEEVLFDVNRMAGDSGFFSLGARVPAPDHVAIAYAVDRVGRRLYDVEIKNTRRGDTERAIHGTSGSIAWEADGSAVYYVKRDPETLRAYQVWRHVLGTPQNVDTLVFEEEDEEFSCYVTRSRSERFLMIVSRQTLATEVRVLDAEDPGAGWRVVAPRKRGHEYSVDHQGDRFLIRTNRDAENFRLVSAPVDAPGNWTELLPHRFNTLLEGVQAFESHFVTRERRGGLVHLVVHPGDGSAPFSIQLDDPAYRVGLSGNAEYRTRKVRYSYSSLTTPSSVLELDLDSGETERLKEQFVGGGFDREDYVSERIFAQASDGTSVPISLVRKRSSVGEPGPLLLYGYGSYGSSQDARFSPRVLSLLDRGFTYAIAHVRGGQELGRFWYEQGKLRRKINTFTDFIACGEHLVAEGYTTEDQLFAMGGSAGGLLMGAVANMRPDLFHGIVAAVPFVDVVTTMLDDSIPLTTFEYDEWGNPNDEGDYRYMLSYSPYDQVKRQRYPHMLVTTGLHDSQVQYFEPAKWVAKLRAKAAPGGLLLFECEMEAGHGGVSGRYATLRKSAMTYAFLLGLVEGSGASIL